MTQHITIAGERVRFPWGAVGELHCIGEYTIVEYVDPGNGGIWYHLYINAENTYSGYSSLDAALIGAIARKHAGPNSQAATHFFKMVDMPEY